MTMTECGALQERMPDVAAGTGVWTEAEAAHLASCGDCALEWRVVQAARQLGAGAAAGIDPGQMATRVVRGVRREQARTRWRRAGWVSGLAAAAVVVLVLRGTGGGAPGGVTDSTTLAMQTPGSVIPMAELDALDADQLESVLEHLDGAAGSAPAGEAPAMGDLDDRQLERVLRSLEG